MVNKKDIPEVLLLAKPSDIDFLLDIQYCYSRTGSSWTCNPPVLDTDEDWIVWDKTNHVRSLLEGAGYEISENQGQYPDCVSYRKGRINIIIIFELELYNKWFTATRICKELNLLKKEDRKLVHRIICGEQ